MASGRSIEVLDVSYVVFYAENYGDFFRNIRAHTGGLFEDMRIRLGNALHRYADRGVAMFRAA